MGFCLLRCMDMVIVIAALENLKSFKNISGELVLTSSGCESATQNHLLRQHSGSLDSQIVVCNARQGRILNCMVLKQNWVNDINIINQTKLHPTTWQCSQHPQEGWLDIDLASHEGFLPDGLEPFNLELWHASRNGHTAHYDLMNLSRSLQTIILQSDTRLTNSRRHSFWQWHRLRSIIFVKLHNINQLCVNCLKCDTLQHQGTQSHPVWLQNPTYPEHRPTWHLDPRLITKNQWH
jgi:hypothetical protein